MRLGLGLRLGNNKNLNSVQFSPTDIEGLVHWYDETSINESGGVLTTWNDKVGSMHWSAVGSPIISTLNGVSCIQMNGTGQGLTKGSSYNESGTIIWVQETTDTLYTTLNDNTVNSNAIVANQGQSFAYTLQFGAPTVFVNGVQQAWSFRSDAYTALNGAVNIVTQVGFSANWTALKWGQQDDRATWGFAGKIAAMYIYNKSLSSEERGSLDTFLAAKYGITLP